jgi:hypothetical protein
MSVRTIPIVLASLLATGRAAPATAASAPAQPLSAPQAPSRGDVFRSFVAESLDGTSKHIDFPKGSSTVLLFFSSGCPVCHRMIPEWNRMFEKHPKSLAVIGVLMDKEPPGFFMATPIAFPVVRSPGNEFMRLHKVNRVPLTLRVSGGGKVEDVGLGVLDPIRLGELFRP